MSHARIVVLGVLVFVASAVSGFLLLRQGYPERPAHYEPHPVAQETVAKSSHAKQDQEQPPERQEVQASPPHTQVTEEGASSLRQSFFNCFGHPPPNDPLLLSERERALGVGIAARLEDHMTYFYENY